MPAPQLVLFTVLAVVAFAANSVLCRMALHGGTIDPASFSTVRFAAGAVMLWLVTRPRRAQRRPMAGDWTTAAVLFLYAIPFSFAYHQLTAGTGALMLFGAVQLTMMVAALWGGERPRAAGWWGLAVALGGLVYLILPGLTAPPIAGAALMTLAGVAWGLYSLRGRRGSDPLTETAGNFARCVPLMAAVSVVTWPPHMVAWPGVALAGISGAVTSGLGYVVWSHALRTLTAAQASIVQLAVPVVAAAGGVVLLSEAVSARLLLASALVLGGIALTLTGLSRRP